MEETVLVKRLLISAFALAAIVTVAATVNAATHTRNDAKAMVMKAVEYLKANGQEKTLAAINDPKGPFVDGDLYVYAMDAKDPQLTMLAHGVVHALVGKPQVDVTDADGKAFNKNMIHSLDAQGEGWIEYRWPNPVTNLIAKKASFVKKVDGLIIGCGIYE
jgi:cytochrome c